MRAHGKTLFVTAVHLVGRVRVPVDAPRGDIDGAMGGVGDAIGDDLGAHGMTPPHDLG